MDLFHLKLIKIFISLRLPLYKDSFILQSNDKDAIIEYIFKVLDHESASLFYLEFSKNFRSNFVFLLQPHFDTVIKSIDFPMHYLDWCYRYLDEKFILSHLETLYAELKLEKYKSIMDYLFHRDENMRKQIRNISPILYGFYDALLESKIGVSHYFLRSIVFPLTKKHDDAYLEFLQKSLFLGKPLSIEYVDMGSSSYAFDVNGMIVKFGEYRNQFPIFMHYRMNDFYVRKRIKIENRFVYIEVSPKGDLKNVTKQDIEDALIDLKEVGLVITDLNYQRNFAYFEQDSDLYFQDVDGIIEVRKAEYSESYQKKKVKLIDHDYIYDENDPKKCWIRKI